MTETERLALTTAFLAAVVVAGLAFSLVPWVELVTLMVFCSGILLGFRGGAVVGLLGMPLYVMANTALRAFPPSPLLILAGQAVGMSLVGLAGGAWARWWRGGGRSRRVAILTLPAVGFLLTAVYQVITNGAYAWFSSDVSGPRLAVFLSGMVSGFVNMMVNTFVFLLAGPQAASILRRLARRRGWWPALLAVVVLLGVAGRPAGAGPASGTVPEPAVRDSVETVPGDVGVPAGEDPGGEPSRIPSLPPALWRSFATGHLAEQGLPGFSSTSRIVPLQHSRVTAPAMPLNLDRWALGWGRTRFSYDGVPLNGPIHGFADPPDIPLAWSSEWKERWVASGTSVEIVPPPPAQESPVSQISLTTGSHGRRTAEFALLRNLGEMDLGVNFRDREESGVFLLDQMESSRFWFRAASTPGASRRWSLDVSSAVEERRMFEGGTLGQDVRRVQGSVRQSGPGGETRLALQLRRLALSSEGPAGDFGEVLFDGFTLQGDWRSSRLGGLSSRVRWDRDRRRGGLAGKRAADGIGFFTAWETGGSSGELGLEGGLGYQEPYGFTWEGAGAVSLVRGAWSLGLALSHQEDMPPLLVGVDRPTPELGVAATLEAYETAQEPENRTALRGEGRWERVGLRLVLGGWLARIRHYRLDSNPLWNEESLYSPFPLPTDAADVAGGYLEAVLEPWKSLYGSGRVLVHDREAIQVPYLARWEAEGAIHWRGLWFKQSIDLDIALGGQILGRRQSPERETFGTAALGFLEIRGEVDNGVLTFRMQNLADNLVESDLRLSDLFTSAPIAGRSFVLGLTMYLSD